MDHVMTTLICGPSKLTELFIFEGAMQWAREGNHVLYVTRSPLQYLPTNYHEGSKPSVESLQLMTFRYIPDYHHLMELFVTLHTFAVLPSVLFIDKLEAYCETDRSSVTDPIEKERNFIIARTCAFIIDAMNVCSRIVDKKLFFCATIGGDAVSTVHSIYFDDIWYLSADNADDDRMESFSLRKLNATKNDPVLTFETLQDGYVALKKISRLVEEDISTVEH